MSYYTSSNTHSGIPVFVIVQDDDDTDSVVTFATGTSSSVSPDDLIMGDSESRWALEPVSSTAAPLRSCPHHPERSVSYGSASDANANNIMNPIVSPSNNNANIRKTHRKNNSGYSNSPTSRLQSLRQKPTAGLHQHAGLGRTTRLTRMAERAKAVARATPISRRGSRNRTTRHSLPAIPLRHKSSSGILMDHTNSNSTVNYNLIELDCSHTISSSSTSLSRRGKQRRNSSMIPRRRNSSIKPQRRNSIQFGTYSHTTDGGTILLTTTASSSLTSSIVSSSKQQLNASRRATGCFQIACAAEFGAATMPPRLPQRYPSEIPMTTSAA